MTIKYVNGDATRPQGDGPKIIAHVCNNIGVWGAGFVIAVSNRWPDARHQYMAWSVQTESKLPLGKVQFVEPEPGLIIANMVAQHELAGWDTNPPIRYEALSEALREVAEMAIEQDASVHMPRIGCGRAGGKWEQVAPIIDMRLCERGISVTVYDWP